MEGFTESFALSGLRFHAAGLVAGEIETSGEVEETFVFSEIEARRVGRDRETVEFRIPGFLKNKISWRSTSNRRNF